MPFEFKSHTPSGPYEGIDFADWSNWKWQLKNSLKTEADFSKVYRLSPEEKTGFKMSEKIFQVRSTPYYATLADPHESLDPLRLLQTPHINETSVKFQEMLDPLGEQKNSATPRLIHRYQDRALLLITDFCSVYCRFCTRKRFTGKHQALLKEDELQAALDYISKTPQIREVILSGGDPLTVGDGDLDRIFFAIRKIPHVEIIRVGSRMTVVNPFRITEDLIKIFRKYKPIYFMNHFNHPKELTAEVAIALERLADGGVPLFNQMVLLNGINNHAVMVQALSRRLLYLRVKPYYMFQCDPSMGTDHLRTSISNSLGIINELWGNLSGLAMPQYSVDIPNGGGKTTLSPQFYRGGADEVYRPDSRFINRNLDTENVFSEPRIWKFKGYDGIESEYVDPTLDLLKEPADLSLYRHEWSPSKGQVK